MLSNKITNFVCIKNQDSNIKLNPTNALIYLNE